MITIPQLKKKISSFLTKEDGKISKEVLIKTGVLLAAIAISSKAVKADCPTDMSGGHSDHCNELGLTYTGGVATGTHNHAYATNPAPPPPSGGGCCFVAGTLITMGDNSTKPIEKVKIGEKVKCYDLLNREIKISEVISLYSPTREGVYNINEGLLKLTNDHPLFVKKKNGELDWASIDPNAAKRTYGLDVSKLEIGDAIFNENKEFIKIKSVEYMEGEIKTYSFKEVKKYNNFFANGLLAHNCGGPCGW